MRLSTSTNIHQTYNSNDYYFSINDSIELCHKVGFEVIDISMNSISRPGFPLSKPDWETVVDKIGEALDKFNIMASQSHALYHQKNDALNQTLFEEQKLQITRCLIASGKLRIPWVVMHPLHSGVTDGLTEEEVIDLNYNYFMEFYPIAQEHNVGIAIENMFPNWFSKAETLLKLLSRLDATVFGACWDTGHAQLAGQNQPESIKLLGDRLKATHIADNHGRHDNHVAPFIGTVDWPQVIHALKHSGYTGDFTYEIHNMTKYLPEGLHEEMIKYTYTLGQFLLNTY